ncbi:MAG TPA: hypothetical protein VEK57_12290 [Thermoanaerobaculia bacterium]|nr:hypothetical protein [Thermoanaerobaculia bacterium]
MSYDGSSWVAVAPSTNEPHSTSASWQLVAGLMVETATPNNDLFALTPQRSFAVRPRD